MSVGLPLTKTDLDARANSSVQQVWGALEQIHQFSELLANTTIIPNDTALTNLGYTSAEVTLLRAGVNDLGSATGLWGVAHNLKTVTAVNNFFFFAQQLTGVNFSG